MKTIGIKLADGSFFPVLEEDTPAEKTLELTTAHNNQTKIMVDLYRSQSCTMDDAEYVDSLQIDNLNAHPNGEPTISFCVSIDEDNKLSARIQDPETGNHSDTDITLVSRTIEERAVTDEYDISNPDNAETEEESNGAGAALAGAAIAGAGLAGAAVALGSQDNEDKVENMEDIEIPTDNTLDSEMPDLPDFDEPINDIPEPDGVVEDIDLADDDLSMEEKTETDNDMVNAADSIDFEDNSLDSIVAEDTESAEEANPEDSIDDLDLSDLDDLGTTESETPADDLDKEIEDINFDDITAENAAPEETVSDNFDLPDFDTDTVSDETTKEDETFNIDDAEIADIPETTDDTNLENTEDNNTVNFEDSIPEETEEATIPDFDLDIPDDFDEDNSNEEASIDDDLSLPDFDTPEEETAPELPDDFFNDDSFDESSLDLDSEPSPTSADAGNLSFTGLYDKETEMGVPGQQDEDIKKKTKVPVIICIVCAVICIIATILILFVIPSKYNLISKAKKNETVIEQPAKKDDTIKLTPEPVPEAKEDEVVIVEKAEEVVPEQPKVIEEKLENTKYKIKWGDTLWDIADTYYKNPWRYKYIARYNGISNPDHIISGTYITIPAE